jgi:hypothetical protein
MPIFIKGIKSIINTPPKEKAPGPHVITGEFYLRFKENNTYQLSTITFRG